MTQYIYQFYGFLGFEYNKIPHEQSYLLFIGFLGFRNKNNQDRTL